MVSLKTLMSIFQMVTLIQISVGVADASKICKMRYRNNTTFLICKASNTLTVYKHPCVKTCLPVKMIVVNDPEYPKDSHLLEINEFQKCLQYGSVHCSHLRHINLINISTIDATALKTGQHWKIENLILGAKQQQQQQQQQLQQQQQQQQQNSTKSSSIDIRIRRSTVISKKNPVQKKKFFLRQDCPPGFDCYGSVIGTIAPTIKPCRIGNLVVKCLGSITSGVAHFVSPTKSSWFRRKRTFSIHERIRRSGVDFPTDSKLINFNTMQKIFTRQNRNVVRSESRKLRSYPSVIPKFTAAWQRAYELNGSKQNQDVAITPISYYS